MNITGNRWMYSATDLVGFLECSHLTSLNRAAVAGQIQMPMGEDPVLDRIAERGTLHEQRFLESLSAEGLPVVKVRCRTPRQMRLANALARLVELAGEGA